MALPTPSVLEGWCGIGAGTEAIFSHAVTDGRRVKSPDEILDDIRMMDFYQREAERKETNERILATIQAIGPN